MTLDSFNLFCDKSLCNNGASCDSALEKPVHISGARDSLSDMAMRLRPVNGMEPRVARPETTTTEAMATHGARVLQTTWNLVSSTEEAQDVFQETFLQHHLAMTHGRTIDNTAARLCTTARHAAFRLRRRKRGPGRRVPEELLTDQSRLPARAVRHQGRRPRGKGDGEGDHAVRRPIAAQPGDHASTMGSAHSPGGGSGMTTPLREPPTVSSLSLGQPSSR